MTDYGHLHDSTLRSLCFDWSLGAVQVTFKTGNEPIDLCVIEATGVSCLACPRLMPWGRSNSVNEISVTLRENGENLAAIEMQSGDTIEILCRSVVMKSPLADGPAPGN